MVDSQKRIAGAFLVGATLVALAFVVSRQTNTQNVAGTLSASTAEREYIEVTDSDSDGIPDWQDALQKNEPIEIPTGTSTYEAPTTVTGKFAVTFFEDYLRSKTSGEFGDTTEELTQKATDKLAKTAQDELFTKDDIIVFPSSDAGTLHAYGNHIASILLAHPREGDSEITIFEDYMRYEKPERLLELDAIALDYTAMVKQMLEAPVPEAYVQQHLNLTNALNAVREDIRAMQKIETDALYTLMRMKRYEDDVLGLSNTLKSLFGTLYLQDNVRWEKSEPASKLFTFTE